MLLLNRNRGATSEHIFGKITKSEIFWHQPEILIYFELLRVCTPRQPNLNRILPVLGSCKMDTSQYSTIGPDAESRAHLRVRVLPGGAIASHVVDSLSAVLSEKPNACIGLTTGTTPLTTGIYAECVERVRAGRLSFAEATLVNPDEFLGLPRDHDQTYHTYSQAHLLRHLPTPPRAWLIPASDVDAASPAAVDECARLERGIRAAGGVDWQLLGIGINGHVCFIEPADSLPSQCYITPIAEVNRVLYTPDFGGDVRNVPTHAITYGVDTLMSAKQCVLVAVGAKKADILARALRGPVTPQLPASFLQLHPNVTLVVDEAAASVLLATPFPDAQRVTVERA